MLTGPAGQDSHHLRMLTGPAGQDSHFLTPWIRLQLALSGSLSQSASSANPRPLPSPPRNHGQRQVPSREARHARQAHP